MGDAHGVSILSRSALKKLLLHAIMEVAAPDFRTWVGNNLRGVWFDMPAMGECKIDRSNLTKRSGFGFFCRGVIEDGLSTGAAIYPKWDFHGDPQCSLCHGDPSNEFSFGSNQNTHSFCFRCIVAKTGDDEHLLENLLFFANHLPQERSNAVWSKDRRCRSRGRVPLVNVKQTSWPCHGEFFITYGTKHDASAYLMDDLYICVGHKGGPKLDKKRKCNSEWRMCQPCMKDYKRRVQRAMGVCPYCQQSQVDQPTHPLCVKCRQRFEDFVWRRTPSVLVLPMDDESAAFESAVLRKRLRSE